MKTYQIRCRETGDHITEFDTQLEAELILNQYAHDDMLEDVPEWESEESESSYAERYEDFMRNVDMDKYRDFYEIVEIEKQ